MFYKVIQKKRDLWLNEPSCPISNLLDYINKKGQMRDAQIEAIKTYLFLKIACNNKSLFELFYSGEFNTLNLDTIEISSKNRVFLEENPCAQSLFEYASLSTVNNEILSPKIVKQLKRNPEDIDYKKIFKKIFYDISYTDYLFSLPMGAGKTYLMAAFIYLDLYFADNEPDNKAFAHNFIILAPSGLKSSVIPSLKTIQKFEPSWIIPEPMASKLKKQLNFELLDQNKTAKNSNQIKNPNVQKIAIHQPLDALMGLVAVTNAEKVILDRVNVDERNGQLELLPKSDDEKDKQANELRNLIGKLPNLSIFIDEVHHAATEDIKLRAVVNSWMKGNQLNSVIGFSGTPYLQKAEKIELTDELSVSSIEIANTVYYYPLVNGIGNFLKRPTVKTFSENSRLKIVENGVRDFLTNYKDHIYANGTCAKLGIYCGTIEPLEEQIYPLVVRVLDEFDINPNISILKFHKGNKKYPQPQDSELEFESLDKPFSQIKIVLLAQIGKEGWDCRSLTGIILSQEGDCPRNMVLQTSCRCLRQVEKEEQETALIYLNESNSKTLNEQLKKQHNMSMQEFEKGNNSDMTKLSRYDRTEYLKLPKIDFYQLKIEHQTIIIDDNINTTQAINDAIDDNSKIENSIRTANMTTQLSDIDIAFEKEKGSIIATYTQWLYAICKGSFGFVTMEMLNTHNEALKLLFKKITITKGEFNYFSSKYDIEHINANIRKAFYKKRSFKSIEELIPEQVDLLRIENFTSSISTDTPDKFYPSKEVSRKIIQDDKGELILDSETQTTIEMLEKIGNFDMAKKLKESVTSHPMKNKSFHYLPYKTDSNFEQVFLEEVLKLDCTKNFGVEVYYNGDRALTDFKIKCYKKNHASWKYIGMYTPDFLILKRDEDNNIYKIIIVETKGRIYANDPSFINKKDFMQTSFIDKNNTKFGYKRFEYLYLEDGMSDIDRLSKTANIINKFFKEN